MSASEQEAAQQERFGIVSNRTDSNTAAGLFRMGPQTAMQQYWSEQRECVYRSHQSKPLGCEESVVQQQRWQLNLTMLRVSPYDVVVAAVPPVWRSRTRCRNHSKICALEQLQSQVRKLC